jgi:uncharacterized C2H2 Zn-finger protein
LAGKLNECSVKLIEIARAAGAPLIIEVVKSIATICGENAYSLWYELATISTIQTSQTSITEDKKVKTSVEGPCWRCEACGKTFTDVKHLVNHITFYVRQRDKAHLELYQRIKRVVDEKGKTFTEVVTEILKC